MIDENILKLKREVLSEVAEIFQPDTAQFKLNAINAYVDIIRAFG